MGIDEIRASSFTVIGAAAIEVRVVFDIKLQILVYKNFIELKILRRWEVNHTQQDL
jgi:hypothetical protein